LPPVTNEEPEFCIQKTRRQKSVGETPDHPH
jgi:hypothetical protein